TLHALTEGNPFFVEEILKSLPASGETWDSTSFDETTIPRTVHDAVLRRAADLSPAARETLNLAAVLGRRFAFSLLLALTSNDETALLAVIKELIDAQLVVEVSTDQFAFRHALTRQAIYTGLLARERQILHRRISETAEFVYADALDAHVEDLAYHAF